MHKKEWASLLAYYDNILAIYFKKTLNTGDIQAGRNIVSFIRVLRNYPKILQQLHDYKAQTYTQQPGKETFSDELKQTGEEFI